jgi:integrase
MVLTEKSVEAIRPLVVTEKGKSRQTRHQIADDELTGFGLRCDPNPTKSDGRKTFFFYGKVSGIQVFKSLGEWPATSVKVARDAAREWAGRAAAWRRDGCPPDKNPFAKIVVQKPTKAPAFSELVQRYTDSYLKAHAKNPERAVSDVLRISKTYFKNWQNRPLDTLRSEDLLKVKEACGEHHATANVCIEIVNRMLNWSAGRRKGKQGKANFWPVMNFAQEVESYPKKERDRPLTEPELERYYSELTKEHHRDLRDFLTLSISTAARKSDVLSAKWEFVYWSRNVWHIPNPKNRKPYDIWLLPEPLKVLRNRNKDQGNPEKGFVFPGTGRSGHLRDVKRQWKRFRETAKLGDFRVHDIRHTTLTAIAESGAPSHQIQKAAGHSSARSTARYIHAQERGQRDAREMGQQKLKEMLEHARKAKKAAARKPSKRAAVSRG